MTEDVAQYEPILLRHYNDLRDETLAGHYHTSADDGTKLDGDGLGVIPANVIAVSKVPGRTRRHFLSLSDLEIVGGVGGLPKIQSQAAVLECPPAEHQFATGWFIVPEDYDGSGISVSIIYIGGATGSPTWQVYFRVGICEVGQYYRANEFLAGPQGVTAYYMTPGTTYYKNLSTLVASCPVSTASDPQIMYVAFGCYPRTFSWFPSSFEGTAYFVGFLIEYTADS